MQEPVVLGVGMTKFGKYLDRSFKDLSREAVNSAMKDAGIDHNHIEAAFVANTMAGAIWGQYSVRGQVFLSGSGLEGIPIYNVENACASASTAFHLAAIAVASGLYDIVLALGVEKMIHPDKTKSFQAFRGATDVEALSEFPGRGESGENQSMFMDLYAEEARAHMEKYGTKIETFAKIAVKNSYNGSLNPFAQYQKPKTIEEVMNSRIISDPLRLYMCSPLSDGATAAIICSKEYAKKLTNNPIFINSSVVLSGNGKKDEISTVERAAIKAYQTSGIGPEDLDVVEVHDAATPGELWAYEQLQLCESGEGARLIENGETEIKGSIPVNPSGGLISKGHPVGATGIAQLVEIVWQIRGVAGQRQIGSNVKVGLAQNAGGFVNGDNAAISIHILSR